MHVMRDVQAAGIACEWANWRQPWRAGPGDIGTMVLEMPVRILLDASAAGPAQAAIPNQWGFALVNAPTAAPEFPALFNQSGSWPAPLRVMTRPGPAAGQVFVIFPHIASAGGVAQVTAVNPIPVWC
jgi:hypothetical protein